MLGYMYTIDPWYHHSSDKFDKCQRLYVVADFYDIEPLRTRATHLFK